MNRNFCIDCGVILCWKYGKGFMAIGSTINLIPFKCPRKKRLHSWSAVKKFRTKHFTTLLPDGHVHYLCNWACNVTSEKMVCSKKNVTCKNCLRIIKNINSGIEMQKYLRGKK